MYMSQPDESEARISRHLHTWSAVICDRSLIEAINIGDNTEEWGPLSYQDNTRQGMVLTFKGLFI